jgi:DNA (cytosine-5)-methyltransferase 1
MNLENFRFIDLCAGIGGLRIPFETRGAEKNSWGTYQLNGECVWVSELDEAARSVYSQNFHPDGSTPGDYEKTIDRDFTLVDPETVPDHELLLAGFPCQPFSNAGLRLGKVDTRGQVFFAIEDIIAAKKPQVVLLENVKGLTTLKNPDGSMVLDEILQRLRFPKRKPSDHNFLEESKPPHYSVAKPRILMVVDEIIDRLRFPKRKASDHNSCEEEKALEYYVPKPKILNARDFGLPQNRQRLFIVAIRSDVAARENLGPEQEFSFPEATHDRDSLRLGDFLVSDAPSEFTISKRLWEGHKARKIRNKELGKGFGYQDFDPESTYVATISSRYFKDGAEALIHQPRKTAQSLPRKLMPIEAARLQGFPKNFELHSSNMKAFQQLGNAVPIPVVEEIALILSNLGVLRRTK